MCGNILKRILGYFVILNVLIIFLHASDFKIKSLRTYSSLAEGSIPILLYKELSHNDLIIEFDLEADVQPNLVIEFRFCDRYWKPYQSYFFRNEGYNNSFNLWFDVLSAAINGANYHYKGSFPSNEVTFPFSGKWIYYITDRETGTVHGYGKFFVVKPELGIIGNITKDRLDDSNFESSIFERTNRLSVEFNLSDGLYPDQVEFVEVVENLMIDYPYQIEKREYNNYRYYEWDGTRKFKFVARDIFPGNEYRSTDFRDARRFLPPGFNAQRDGTEISRTYKYGGHDLNGRSLLTNFKDNDSEYLNVHFSILPSVKINNSIYLTGSFNDWKVLPQYQLTKSGDYYEIDMELKRGRYDYLYVTGNTNSNYVENINWNTLEGNFWETKNDYHVFLYYNATEYGGYDKIIGYVKLSSGVK